MSKEETFEPLGHTVLLKEIETEGAKQKDGIFLPDGVEAEQRLFKVTALGTGTSDNKKFPVKVGDTVIIDTTGNTQITLGGDKCIICECTKLLALVK